MGKTLADGYLELRLDPSKLDNDTKKAFKAIGFKQRAQQAGREAGDGLAQGFSDKAGTFAKVAATTAARLSLFGAAASAAAPGVLQLTAALAPAAGSLVALPAAMLAVKAASATFKIAVAGVGSAIETGLTGTAKEAEKALKELTPAQRSFAKSIIALKPQIETLKASVSERFFRPLQDDIAPLANKYLPMLTKQMSDLAGPLGGLGEQFAQTASRGLVFNTVGKLFDQTGLAVIRLRGAVDPLVWSLALLVRDTVGELPKLASGFAGVAERFADWMADASDAGKITAAFRNGVATLKDLGAIVGNVGSILRSVFSAATAGGTSLLGNLRALTGQAAAFLQTGTGSSALTAVFQTIGQLGQALRTSLAAVLPAIAQSIGALAPAVGNLAPVFAQLVVAVAPLLPYVTQLAVALLTRLTPAVAAFAGWVATNEGTLKTFAITLGAVFVAIKSYEIYTKAAAVATTIWTIAQKAAGVAAKVWAGFQWLLNAALTANPIGIVVAALGALVAAIVIAYKNSETFRGIVQAAWQGIQNAVAFAWNNVIKPAVGALVNFFRGVIAPAAMWLWRNIFQPAFSGISFAVKAAWVIIQIALKAFQLYLNNVIFPVVRFLYTNVIRPVFAAIGAVIRTWYNNVAKPVFNLARTAFSGLGIALRAVWNGVIKPVFSALGGFLTGTVLPAFRKGVDLIRGAWDKVRDAAKVPVRFVVLSVINPLVRGINKVASFVGVKDTIPEIGGFATGGQIPGHPSHSDNRLAAGPAGLLKVASGEWINRTASTVHNLPLLKRVNSLSRSATMDDLADVVPDGRARGGRVGDGIGDFFGKIGRGLKGAADVVLNPKQALTKVANAALSRIPGGGALAGVVKGMGKRLIAGVGSFLDSKLGGAIGGGGIGGGYRGMQRAISARFPGLNMISGFRPGARTLSGNRSYHSLGRAVDYPPNRALAAWIRSTYGAKTKELITPFQELNLLNGRRHRYTGAVWNQHNFAGGNAHVHWAAANGGLIGKRSGLSKVPVFDRGGILAPGLNLIRNKLGRPEPLMRALPIDIRKDTRTANAARRSLDEMLKRLSGGRGNPAGGGSSYSRDSETVRLHPADIERLGLVIGREMAAAVGGANYAAGRRSALYARGA